jgi:hypothetical protein
VVCVIGSQRKSTAQTRNDSFEKRSRSGGSVLGKNQFESLEPSSRSLIERLAEVEIAAAEPADASATYERNFGFERRNDGGVEKVLVGDCELKIVPTAGREGLASLWLECDDLDRTVAALDAAGIEASSRRIHDGRRIVELAPRHTAGARVIIFDRRAD